MSYSQIRRLLFRLDPERAHALTLSLWRWLVRLRLNSLFVRPLEGQGVTLMRIDFPNRLGVAAGLDKNADYIDALLTMGFGFIEVGGVTPVAQTGNAKPRLFRIPEAEALINRMGFNNLGLEYIVKRLKQYRGNGVVGVNLAKNRETPLAEAEHDYARVYEGVYPYADFATINISSPNTPGLRELGSEVYLENLINHMKEKQIELEAKEKRYVPLLIKLSIDIEPEALAFILDVAMRNHIDGIICSNTSVDHTDVTQFKYGLEPGGLSGKPIHVKSVEMIKKIRGQVGPKLPIIGVGGIVSAEDARRMFEAGADLVQIYTGLIYRGPNLINKILTLN